MFIDRKHVGSAFTVRVVPIPKQINLVLHKFLYKIYIQHYKKYSSIIRTFNDILLSFKSSLLPVTTVVSIISRCHKIQLVLRIVLKNPFLNFVHAHKQIQIVIYYIVVNSPNQILCSNIHLFLLNAFHPLIKLFFVIFLYYFLQFA